MELKIDVSEALESSAKEFLASEKGRSLIAEIVKETSKPQRSHYLQTEVLDMLGVTAPTLNRYVSLGLLTKSKIAGHVVFDASEVQKVLDMGIGKGKRYLLRHTHNKNQK